MPHTMRLAELEPAARRLIDAAVKARSRAHAPYSGHAVGAAALSDEGEIYPGCNVEISSYGLTLCAERVALFAARAAGAGSLVAVAVVGPGLGDRPTPPCGACRQVVFELAGDCTVYLANDAGVVEVWDASELLPRPFGPAHLEDR